MTSRYVLPGIDTLAKQPAIERARKAAAARDEAQHLVAVYAEQYALALLDLQAERGRGWTVSVAAELGVTPESLQQTLQRRQAKRKAEASEIPNTPV